MHHIRLVSPDDASDILAIYAPIIENGYATFETEVASLSAFRERIVEISKTYPWIVWEKQNQVLGYAYASKFHDRVGYTWTANTSVYVHEAHRGTGIARQLYTVLLELMKLQGFYNACAGIALPNAASEHLHLGMGFKRVALYENAGYKIDRWVSVAWHQLPLRPFDHQTPKPLLSPNAAWQAYQAQINL